MVVWVGMKLAGVVLISATTLAHATTFDEYAAKQPPRPASQLFEASCEMKIDLRGAVASVEVRQRIANAGPVALAARHEFTLPRGAIVTGFRAKGQGAVEQALAVPADFATTKPGASDVLGTDPALLVARARDSYEITIQPIEPAGDITLTTTYVVVADVQLGSLHLELPSRSSPGKLAACKGTLRAAAGPGAKVKKIRIGGVEAGARGTAPFVVDANAVALDVELEVLGRDPIVWTQTQALADGWHASLVTVLAPRIAPVQAKRVVFLVDLSRSMDLVGRQNIIKVIRAVGNALPAGAEVEAIAYARTAQRVFGEFRTALPGNMAVLEGALLRHPSTNGSDVVAAYQLAKQALANTRGASMLVTITDGVTADLASGALVNALAVPSATVDVHTIVLDPATTRSPGADALRAPVATLGGAYVEVAVDELDRALAAIDQWLRPSARDLSLGGPTIPQEVHSGGGFTQAFVHKGSARFLLTGRTERAFRVAARPAPAVPIGALVLATADTDEIDPQILVRAGAAFPFADESRAFAVLTQQGRIAKDRRAMVRGGGRYERVVAIPDPDSTATPRTAPRVLTASAIARDTLERMFREQLQPKAYACYQRALGQNPKLAGTARFRFRMGRGEITDVQLAGLNDAALDACLLDAAYLLAPPFPDFTLNADDQTIANYPLAFSRRADQPYVVLGDADSSSPIDIDAVQGGVPGRPVKVDAKNPLGGMRAPKSP
ncbi:MAG TPA: VIT domain-containing protein [Kofleriaceae bacterium]